MVFNIGNGLLKLAVVFIALTALWGLWNLSSIRKWIYCSRSKMIGKFSRFKLIVKSKFIEKHRTLLQFIVDFSVFWFIFMWRGGVVLQLLLDFIQPLRDAALTWSEENAPWNMQDLSEILIVFLYLSPYGRPNAIRAQFRFALHICTVCTAICLVLYFVLASDTGKQRRNFKMLIAFLSGIVTWYAGYGVCGFIEKIPFFYHVLAFIAALVANIAIFFVVLIIWVYLGLLDD